MKRRYGEVGMFRGATCDFTFMVVAPAAEDGSLFRNLLMVVLLAVNGPLPYQARMMGRGDMGPVKAAAREIVWGYEWPS